MLFFFQAEDGIRDRSRHPAEPLFRSVFFCVSKNVSVSCAYTQGKREQFSDFNRTLDAINNVFRKFSAFHDETARWNIDGMNTISNDGSNKLNRSRKARVSYKVQRTINASLRSEERFSRNAETDLVCCLLLEKKKKKHRGVDGTHTNEGTTGP